MKNKADRFYFENFVEAAECSCRAADFLVECLKSFDRSKIVDMLKKMHQIEHEGDTKRHAVSKALAKAFVTPVDREDLALISQNIDEVTDSVEEILQRVYIDGVTAVPPEAVPFAQKLADGCRIMKNMLSEFQNFKKPARLHELIVEINRHEEECDKIYLSAAVSITDHSSDALEIVSWREIYEKMDDCADACEHVGECVGTVVMKNT